MIREELVEKIAESIATMEGYFLTPSACNGRKITWPPKARRLGNPGMIRSWKDASGKPYPREGNFVDFIQWAKNQDKDYKNPYEKGHKEGWRVLRVLISHYIEGRYHDGKSPNLYELFEKYAPSSDSNDPKKYAEFVANRVGILPTIPLEEVIYNDEQAV